MNKLLDYATNVAFHMTISHRQLDFIWWLYQGQVPIGFPTFVTTWRALEAKGVAAKRNFTLKEAKSRGHLANTVSSDSPPGYPVLTKEGQVLADFLDKVGAFDQFKSGERAA